MRCLRSIVAFAVVTLLAVHAAPAPVPGQSTFTADRYVESVAGNLPMVLTAPHGGALKPDSIANRKEGVLGADLNSLELARALAAELFARSGRHPALVASHLHRSKLDPNREIKEAAQGDPTAESAWRDFHAAIRAALGNVDFKPTILALMGITNPTTDEGRDASVLFRTGRAPADWADHAFVRIGGGPKRTTAGEDGELAEGNGWLGTFSRDYKFIVAPGAAPSLFDLANDPHELTNLFTAPAQRDTVRRLATALHDYAQRFQDPHLAAARVKSDLAWAMSASADYPAPAAPAAPADPAPAAGKTKRKNKQK